MFEQLRYLLDPQVKAWNEEASRTVCRLLQASLAEYLALPIDIVHAIEHSNERDRVYLGPDQVVFRVRSSNFSSGALVSLGGIVSASLTKRKASALLFIFLFGEKASQFGSTRYLRLSYGGLGEAVDYSWMTHDWIADEFGEYLVYDRDYFLSLRPYVVMAP